ncbi:MAG: hypothetical protein HUJ62_07780 [Streptococcus gallolyticus]|nr:hypothetical protein [Streptococcus gallolyticus]
MNKFKEQIGLGQAKTRTLAVALCMLLALVFSVLAISACSSGGSGSSSSAASSPQDLILEDSGYYTTDSKYTSTSYVKYAVKIKNPNSNYKAIFPKVKVVGKDASGNIIFSDDWVLSTINPEETQWAASQAGNGVKPATVEFSVSVDSSNWKKSDEKYENPYTISNLNTVANPYFGSSITGQLTKNKDDDCKQVKLTAVFKDANGKCVGGYSTYVDSPATGTPTAFEIKVLDNSATYASYEVYANSWY